MASKKAKRYVEISNDDGAIALAAAIVRKARTDYIQGDTYDVEAVTKFVETPWFETLTLGKASPDTVLKDWERSRYVYKTWDRIRFLNSDEKEAKQDARYFRNLIRERNISLLELVSYLNNKYCLGIFFKEEDEALLERYGWPRQFCSERVCETFRPTLSAGGKYYMTSKEPVYLSARTEPLKEVDW